MFLSLLTAILRFFLRLRYRVEISGLDQLQTPQPIVVLPNHPALVDPMILLSFLGEKKILSPVMTESYFSTPGLGPILRALQTIPVGDLEKGGSLDAVKQAFGGIETAISKSQNIILYPSGHIYVQPYEHIVGKKMGYEIVGSVIDQKSIGNAEIPLTPFIKGEGNQIPHTLEGPSKDSPRLLVVRTRGLWGSLWSKAYTGASPDLIRVILSSIWYILANGIFFMPRRRVEIEIVDMTERLQEWYSLGVDAFNTNLQNYGSSAFPFGNSE